MEEYYDRYKGFRSDGVIRKIPKMKIDVSDSDLYIVFDKSTMRLDNLSYKYYGDPNFGWLLLMANPSLGTLEFNIPDKSRFRIPYPLNDAIIRYETAVKNAK